MSDEDVGSAAERRPEEDSASTCCDRSARRAGHGAVSPLENGHFHGTPPSSRSPAMIGYHRTQVTLRPLTGVRNVFTATVDVSAPPAL